MAIRGVYTEAEQKMLDDANKNMDARVGWYKSPDPMVATEESMLNYAYIIDPKNPLWRDENYARNTRWSSPIAFPTFIERIGIDPTFMSTPPELGYRHMILIGEDYEFFKPIRVNDSFKVWRRRPQIQDVTSLDGKGPRKFAVLIEDFDIINQKDELVSTYKHYTQFTFLPEAPKPYSMPEYGYTMAELEYIDRIEEEEEIRGANIRYWENVSTGDTLKPIVNGPVTYSEGVAFNVAVSSGLGHGHYLPPLTKRASLKQDPADPIMVTKFVKDPATGLYYYLGFRHFEDRAAQADGEPRAFLYSALSRHWLCRLVTNWMGDDGFIRKFNYRHMRRNFLGETLIGRGKVINKRVEKDEHLVDLDVWIENMRGNTTEAAAVTVSLLSKEIPLKWK